MNLQEQDVVKSSVGPLQVFSTAILTSLPHTQTQKPLRLPYTRLKHPQQLIIFAAARGGAEEEWASDEKFMAHLMISPHGRGALTCVQTNSVSEKLPKFFHFGLKNYMEKQVHSDFSMKGKRSVAASQLLLIRLCRWSWLKSLRLCVLWYMSLFFLMLSVTLLARKIEMMVNPSFAYLLHTSMLWAYHDDFNSVFQEAFNFLRTVSYCIHECPILAYHRYISTKCTNCLT